MVRDPLLDRVPGSVVAEGTVLTLPGSAAIDVVSLAALDVDCDGPWRIFVEDVLNHGRLR